MESAAVSQVKLGADIRAGPKHVPHWVRAAARPRTPEIVATASTAVTRTEKATTTGTGARAKLMTATATAAP